MGPAVSFDVNSTLGAVEIGVLVSYFSYLGWSNVLPRLFSNSLLASLNSRMTLRAMNEVPLPSLHFTSEIACDEATHGEWNKAATENI
ncbi:hypothetical protein B0H13DRAFT_2670543 [Mycena leptocephala]|nr:hypothetical protein B0H13DRAFT_2670543 [Mycena leptocephala]